MEYKDLATLYHMDGSPDRAVHSARELAERQQSPSTFGLDFDTPAGKLFLAVPRELSALTQRVLRRERRVSNLMRSSPGIAGNEVLRSLVVDEVVMSNSIENIHSTRKQIDDTLASLDAADPKRKRFREFARLYLDLAFGDFARPETPEDIRAIYDKIMDGEDASVMPDGALFRKDPVFVSDGMQQVHTGLYPESEIVRALEAMLSITSSEEIPELYSALVGHYIFEYIHPFYDGNGRTGRYLLSLFLELPLSKPTALSLSRVMAENRSRYYQAFQSVENPLNHGEITFFVITMHELILMAQDRLIQRLESNNETLALLEQEADDLAAAGEYSEKELALIFGLVQQAAFGVGASMRLDMLCEIVGLGVQQTRKYLRELEEREVVVKTRGRNPLAFALTSGFLQAAFPEAVSSGD